MANSFPHCATTKEVAESMVKRIEDLSDKLRKEGKTEDQISGIIGVTLVNAKETLS